MTMNKRETDIRLSQMAARLRLVFLRDHMEDLMVTASDAKMTPREVLEYVFTKEIDQRESNRIKISTMAAHFPKVCTLEGFDMTAQPSLDPGLIRELANMEWVETGENVLLIRYRPSSLILSRISSSEKFCTSSKNDFSVSSPSE